MGTRGGGTTPQRPARTRRKKTSHPSGIATMVGNALGWADAHVDLDRAVADFAVELRGQRPPGMPHSPWEIVEHIRIAQHDILDFCRNPSYAELKWPDDYWPASSAPPSAAAWDASIAAFHRDLKALQGLATDPHVDLAATIAHGSGQTYLRELLLVIDHNAYHVGEIVAIRRMLAAWP